MVLLKTCSQVPWTPVETYSKKDHGSVSSEMSFHMANMHEPAAEGSRLPKRLNKGPEKYWMKVMDQPLKMSCLLFGEKADGLRAFLTGSRLE